MGLIVNIYLGVEICSSRYFQGELTNFRGGGRVEKFSGGGC